MNTRIEDLHVAIFGALYEGDPINISGPKRVAIKETLYPPLTALADYFGYQPEYLYDRLVSEGRISFRCNEELVVATLAYTHDNNTSGRLQ